MDMSALTGIVSIILGVVYSIQAYNLPRATVGKPMSPILFPLGLGALLVIFGIILLVQQILKGKLKIQGDNKPKEKGFSYSAKLIGYTCVVSIIYALLFERIGFVFSTFLFMQAVLMVVNGKMKWKTNTMVSAFFSIGIYVVFAKLFGISLPITPFIYI